MYNIFAISPVGLERLIATELTSISGIVGVVVPGGVEFVAPLSTLFQLNRTSRLTTRFLVRVGDFRVRALGELRRKVALLNWGPFLHPRCPIVVSASCHKSRIYHSGAAEQRVVEAVEEIIGVSLPENPTDDAQRIYVRIVHDHCTISIDSSGERLHLRGYRSGAGVAPIRETLAAAVLALSNWSPPLTLLDPMCGSGTFVIEAASLALSCAPGAHREFAMTRWPVWTPPSEPDTATTPTLSPHEPFCYGYDVDAHIIVTAQQNAENAMVANGCRFSVRDIRSLEPPTVTGLIVCNPPYGWRLGTMEQAVRRYAELGAVLNQRFRGWSYAILAPNDNVFGATRLRASEFVPLQNGGRRIVLAKGQLRT